MENTAEPQNIRSRDLDIKERKSVFREYAEAIIIAAVLALFIRTFIVQAFKIPSGSMEDTLLIGDHILVNKFVYGTRIPFTDTKLLALQEPKRGDIIVFKYPEDESKDFIKRVVGTPGDTVEIVNKKVLINGKPIDEPYSIFKEPNVTQQVKDNYGPVKVPPRSYFMMGDNRDQSLDSRFWGFVDEKKVVGKALVIYWSWDREDSWVRWKRFGHLVK